MLTSQAVKKMQNEIKSLKAVQPINGGALTRHSVSAVWQGSIDRDHSISMETILAAFVMKFSRTDGVNKTPLVQFTYTLEPDENNYSHTGSYGVIIDADSDSVTYKIMLSANYWWPYDPGQTIGNLKITGNAFSMVEGELTIERVYS